MGLSCSKNSNSNSNSTKPKKYSSKTTDYRPAAAVASTHHTGVASKPRPVPVTTSRTTNYRQPVASVPVTRQRKTYSRGYGHSSGYYDDDNCGSSDRNTSCDYGGSSGGYGGGCDYSSGGYGGDDCGGSSGGCD